jgi:DNA-binding SARP family transcriptional activator
MWLGVLGPITIRVEDRRIMIPAAKQRTVLAILLVNANRVVSVDELADSVWDGLPPQTARVTIRGYIRRLRDLLGPVAGARIVTRDPGYISEFRNEELDILQFARLSGDGGRAFHARAWEEASRVLGEALLMWRGTPLSDVPCQRLVSEEVPRLHQMRLQAAEWRAEAELHLGRHDLVVSELTRLVAEEPLRERFHLSLMTALSRCGRTAEALVAYQNVRRLLVEELGVEPGAELQELHQRLLRPDAGRAAAIKPDKQAQARQPARSAARAASISVIPQQLPPAPASFVGRRAALAELDEVMRGCGGATGSGVIAAIVGTAGVGKTALAVQWARKTAASFPDGQLYVDLRGSGSADSPVSERPIRSLLEALGAPAEQIPAERQAQVGLYRSLVAAKRMLVLLDDARDAAQVRPLLAAGPGCMVVVTSRNQMLGLAAINDARVLDIDVLTASEAEELLMQRLGHDRAKGNRPAIAAVARRCDRLPLALNIAAARAVVQPDMPLSVLARDLQGTRTRLDALQAGEPCTDMRATFSRCCLNLTVAGARMFRLLGLHPGPDITVPAAASLAGIQLSEARKQLTELTVNHLVKESAPGRFAFYDLLHAFAAEQAWKEDYAAQRQAATARMLDYYLRTAWQADRLLYPHRNPLAAVPPVAGVAESARFGDRAQARAWFEAERNVLAAVAIMAIESGFDRHADQLILALAE